MYVCMHDCTYIHGDCSTDIHISYKLNQVETDRMILRYVSSTYLPEDVRIYRPADYKDYD